MRPIGIFDSGVGGLGIFKKLKNLIPNQELVYFADNNNLPFGQKTVEQMHQITSKILNFLIAKHNIKMAVVACNTATVSSIDFLRQNFSIPIVGVVPVVKPACQASKTKKVAILATPLTAQSEYQKDLIKKFAGDVQVFSIPCPGLVEMVEAGELDTPNLHEKLNFFLNSALQQNVDVVGLSCTHFPFVQKQIRQICGPQITIMDSNEPVAQQVLRVLKTMPEESIDNKHAQQKFYVTKNPENFEALASKLLDETIERVELVVL